MQFSTTAHATNQLQELFENVYFCQEQKPDYMAWAQPLEKSEPVQRMAKLAKELRVVLPVSFFEAANNALFNSLAMIDADGTVLGVYRKSHIPDGPGCAQSVCALCDVGVAGCSRRSGA